MKYYAIGPRVILFLALIFVFFFMTAPIPVPSLFGLGEVRVLLVGLLARLSEEALYLYIVKGGKT